MFDRILVRSILLQIADALEKISLRFSPIRSASDFSDSASGVATMDAICMRFLAVGEAVKNLDKLSAGTLLSRYPSVDWKGIMGFRDILAHHYFDIDAEQVFWICSHEIQPLSDIVEQMIQELS